MRRYISIPTLGLCSIALLGCMQSGRYDYASYRSKYGAATPQTAEPAAGSGTLPPLNLPVREDWSSARCPDLAVTFSGHSQPFRSSPADDASFQEARQFRDRDYYEVAECFCAKYGDLSQTTKPAADAVMAQTAQQFSDVSHMRIRSATFVENGPLGKYSELQAVSQPPSATAAALRTYWRGQCSMRVEAIWNPGTSARAQLFLNSLYEVKGTAADKAGAAAEKSNAGAAENANTEAVEKAGAAAAGAAPSTSASDAAVEKTDMGDLASEYKRRQAELAGGAPPAAGAPASAASGETLSANAATRLRQLKELGDGGLITKEEYETKRRAILQGL